MDDGSAWFKDFHGRRPTVTAERVVPPRWLADLGPAVFVGYLRETPRGPELRVHPFAPHARPALARTDSGSLTFVGGAYAVGRAGIVDASTQAIVRGDVRRGFSAMAPRVTPQGVPVHGRAVPAEGVLVPRSNPITVDAAEFGSRLVSAGVISGTALGAVGLSDLLVERTTLTENQRAAVQGGALVGLGSLLLLTEADDVGTGLVAGGFVGAGLRYARVKQLDRMVAGWIQRMWPGRGAAAADAGAVLWGDEGGVDVRVEAAAEV